MNPDFNERLRERMEQASLKELMPDFSKDEEWEKLSFDLKGSGKRKWYTGWLKVAAVLIVIAGGMWLFSGVSGGNDEQGLPVVTEDTAASMPQNEQIDMNAVAREVEQATVSEKNATDAKPAHLVRVAKNSGGRTIAGARKDAGSNRRTVRANTEQFFNYYRANEFVCNGTQCPLEICIVQTFRCRDAKPSAVATCSTLAPDEARQLRYKALDKKGKDCKVTVDEIRIKRVSTGETIVLNAHSKPSTAEELFSCITGESKCNVLAGIFDADCNNHCNSDNLTIYNTQGNVILQ